MQVIIHNAVSIDNRRAASAWTLVWPVSMMHSRMSDRLGKSTSGVLASTSCSVPIVRLAAHANATTQQRQDRLTRCVVWCCLRDSDLEEVQ